MIPAETIVEPCRIAISNELVRRGWTQADLARHIGMSQKHISQALTGRTTAYGGLALMLYALGLEVTVGPGRMRQAMDGIEAHFADVDALAAAYRGGNDG